MAYSIENVINIWDDETGERICIREDGDGLGLSEIQYIDQDNKVGARITMTDTLANIVLKQFEKYLSMRKETLQ